ncbi:hypothetical protein KI387_016451, partial [Taxus chinensis]
MKREKKKKWPRFDSQGVSLRIAITVLIVIASTLVLLSCGHLLIRANEFGRNCFQFPPHDCKRRQFKIAMVTLSDESDSIPDRSFEGIMKMVEPNKRNYAHRHGYDFIDASIVLDRQRPPSWSKILAVRAFLPDYDWIFWNDADSLVTNPDITLEDILYSVSGNMEYEKMPNFILTKDVTGVNAGMFFFRNSEWSKEFLDLWWNQISFIRPFGESKSGDNDALKHLIKNMSIDELKQNVCIPEMQCIFNSYLWTPSWKSSHRLMTLTRTVWKVGSTVVFTFDQRKALLDTSKKATKK